MKIAIVNPGLLRVPPDGYGAIEKIIWETYKYLKKYGYEVTIIDEPTDWEHFLDGEHFARIIFQLGLNDFDIIHFHSEKFMSFLPIIEEKFPKAKILFTSHSPYVGRSLETGNDVYISDYNLIIKNNKYYNICVSEKDFNGYLADGAKKEMMFVSRNGCSEDYHISYNPDKYNRSVCLAAIDTRKNQHILQNIECIDFIGPPLNPQGFNLDSPRYLGERNTEYLLKNLTEYGNMILLTQAENGTPLVIQEALMSGLGVVVSKYAAWEIDADLPFISVVDDSRFNDTEYVSKILEENRKISLSMRQEIRDYAKKQFSWDTVAKNYIQNINRIVFGD